MTYRDEDDVVLQAGYKPQLHRSLGFFSSFAVSFSLMSITTGIFANYGFVLGKAGPFGFWTWLLVGAGQTLVALVFAEMAGRIPLTGYAYNWNSKLAKPVVGWFTGWLALSFYTIGVAATSSTAVPVLGAILGYDIEPRTGTYLVIALIIVQALINTRGVKLTSHANVVAVIAEIVGMGVLGAFVLGAVIVMGNFNVELLTTVPAEPRPYWPAFLMASLMGAWTFVGFEAAADLTEETVDARRVAPQGIMSSILISVIVGFIFIAIMTVAIPDIQKISGATYPLAAITSHYFGGGVTNTFLGFVLIAVCSCSLVTMTAASRLLFAMARDNKFLASSIFRQISAHRVPAYGIWFIALVAVIFTLLADSVTSLYGAVSVLSALVYLITIVSFAIGSAQLPPSPSFSLGSWHWPVIVLAAAWLIAEIGLLTIPDEFHPVALATFIVVVTGAVLYPIIGRR